MEECDFYCLSYKNPERKQSMENRFKQLGINAFISDGVSFDDPRIKNSKGYKRTLSFTFGHLDLIKDFYFLSDKEYGVICEDDIFIRKDFVKQLPIIIQNFKKMKLDVLLLGYLLNYNINFQLKETEFNKEEHPFDYYSFPDNFWGAQSYIISKKHANYLIKKFSYPYSELSIENKKLKPFNADWCFTKEGNRALIYPPICIEDGKTIYEDSSQQIFHDSCHKFCYKENIFYD